MEHPTDDELEAMAVRLECDNWFDAAAMLRAMKGRDTAALVDAVWSEYRDSVNNKWTFRKDHVENAVRRTLAALESAPDARQEGWNAAIEAAADKAYLQADIDARPQALSEAIRALKKGPRHDT